MNTSESNLFSSWWRNLSFSFGKGGVSDFRVTFCIFNFVSKIIFLPFFAPDFPIKIFSQNSLSTMFNFEMTFCVCFFEVGFCRRIWAARVRRLRWRFERHGAAFCQRSTCTIIFWHGVAWRAVRMRRITPRTWLPIMHTAQPGILGTPPVGLLVGPACSGESRKNIVRFLIG